MRFEFSDIKKEQILIYDSCNSEFIINALKSVDFKSFFVLEIRKKSVNLSILFSLAFYLILFKTRSIKISYLAAVVKKVDPKYLITFMDNNRNFYELSLYFPNIRFFSIQNGNRGFCSEKKKYIGQRFKGYFFNLGNKYYPVNYLSIGNFENLYFKKYCNFRLKKISPIGSLSLSHKFYKGLYNNKSVYLDPKFDLGIVGNGGFGSFKMSPDEKLTLIYLRKLLKENKNLKFCYISKFSNSHKYSFELKSYISEYFNNEVKYFEYTNNNFEIAVNCKMLIGSITSMLREAYSMGIKVYSTNLSPQSVTTPYNILGFKKFPTFKEFRDSFYKILNKKRSKYFDLENQKLLDLNSFEGKNASENLANVIKNDYEKNK